MGDRDELALAVKRLAALPTPGPSLVDQLGDAHAVIKRLQGAIKQIAVVAADNESPDCNHKMALDFVRQIANEAMPRPRL